MRKLRMTYTAPQTNVYLWEPRGRLLAGSVPEIEDELIDEETEDTWAPYYEDWTDDETYLISED